MSPKPWEVVGSEPVADCAVFDVSRVHTRSPLTGGVHPFYRIGADPWVNVVPVTDSGEIVMVRQWRHGLRGITLEIPGGIVDPGETPEAAAGRELLEETGYRARSFEPLGALNPNPALFANRVHSYLARGAERVGEPTNPGHEETVVELVPAADVAARVLAGDVDHALVVAALYFWDRPRDAAG